MKNKLNKIAAKKELLCSQQIFSGRLLLAIISGQKSNFSSEFKLELETAYI